MQTLLNLLAAIALLVWGTHIVRTGVLRVYGTSLRQVLRRNVGNRGTGFVAGVAVTGLLQSSTATALLTSSFVSQGMIGTAAALAVMLGADVGTALMVQLFSLNLTWLAPLLIVSGVIVYLSKKNERAGQIGKIALGLGVMILALQLIAQATVPLTKTLVRMRGTDETLPRCVALDGKIGHAVRCTIYENRPRPCHDFAPYAPVGIGVETPSAI